jgi:hypothetical protein
MGEMRIAYNIVVGKPENKGEHLEELDVNGKTISD